MQYPRAIASFTKRFPNIVAVLSVLGIHVDHLPTLPTLIVEQDDGAFPGIIHDNTVR